MAKPVIGINCDLDTEGTGRPLPRPYLFIYTAYFDAVAQAAGIPLLIPFMDNQRDIEQALSKADALLLTGGGDVDPAFYKSELHPETVKAAGRRLQFDLSITKMALSQQKPILGICMGMQMLNVAAGGTLRQAINRGDPEINHKQMNRYNQEVHNIQILPDTRLAQIVGDNTLRVNSTHHHGVDQIAPGFRVSATAPDGLVEAIESKDAQFVIGVQWHPERLLSYSQHLTLFTALIEYSKS